MNDTHTFTFTIGKEELIKLVDRDQKYWEMKRAIEKYFPGMVMDIEQHEEETTLDYLILRGEILETMFGDEPFEDLECLTAEQWVNKYWPVLTME